MTEEQRLVILQNVPDSAFCFLTLSAKGDGTVEVHQCDLFGNNLAAICTVVSKLKEIQSSMEEETDKALVHMIQNPEEDDDDYD